jgi:hypothetical protein
MGRKKEHGRMRREKRTIEAMLRIYCRDHHLASGLCTECSELLEYARRRLDGCRYQEKKPTCGNCPVHCYKPSMKEKVMDVMRYSGPRMTLRHPYYAFMHLIDGFRRPDPEKSSGGKKDSVKE